MNILINSFAFKSVTRGKNMRVLDKYFSHRSVIEDCDILKY